MSGFGADVPSDPNQNANVIGSLNKPFTSDLLLKTVATYLPNRWRRAQSESVSHPTETSATYGIETSEEASPTEDISRGAVSETPSDSAPSESIASSPESYGVGAGDDAWWSAAPSSRPPWPEAEASSREASFQGEPQQAASATDAQGEDRPVSTGDLYFCGDTSFFSLNRALHAIASQKLTGTLRLFWENESVELFTRDGQVSLVTTRNPELYCSEAPVTLANLDAEKVEQARQQQRESGQPLFIALAQEDLITREPAAQLVQHYGQKLFARLWSAPRVRFAFEQSTELPRYVEWVWTDDEMDHWVLVTLRFIQHQELGGRADYNPTFIPAYTRDGFDRVQRLRLTVAEAQFASQFNGSRSIAQIAKNLRLDLKFARLTLFRFVALEIVECWPPAAVGAKQEKQGFLGRIFGG